jgi:hypothetical protein
MVKEEEDCRKQDGMHLLRTNLQNRWVASNLNPLDCDAMSLP